MSTNHLNIFMECERAYFSDFTIRESRFLSIQSRNSNSLIDTPEEEQELKDGLRGIIESHPGETLHWREDPSWTYRIPEQVTEASIEEANSRFRNAYNDYYAERHASFELQSSLSFGLRSIILRPLSAKIIFPFTEHLGLGIQGGYASLTLLDPNLVTNERGDQFQTSFSTHPWVGACFSLKTEPDSRPRIGLETCVDFHFPDETRRVVQNGITIHEESFSPLLIAPSLNLSLEFYHSRLFQLAVSGGGRTVNGLFNVVLLQADLGVRISFDL